MAMSSVYAPRSTLCIPDNAYSLAVTSTEIVVGTSVGEKLFNVGLIIMSETVDVEEWFTLMDCIMCWLGVLVTWSVTTAVSPFFKVISFVSISIEKGSGIDVSTTPILFSTHSVNQIF